MDRMPKRAPFKPGTRVRYLGTTESYTYDINPETRERKLVPLLVPGLEVIIDHVKTGRQGTLRHLSDSDGPMYYEDSGEPILDTTTDSYSVYKVEAVQNGVQQGRIIWPDTKKDWQVVTG